MAGGRARTGAGARARQATRQTDAGASPRRRGALCLTLDGGGIVQVLSKGGRNDGAIHWGARHPARRRVRSTPAVRGPLAPLGGRMWGEIRGEMARKRAISARIGGIYGGFLSRNHPQSGAFGAGFTSIVVGCSQVSCDGTHVLPSFLCLSVVPCPVRGISGLSYHITYRTVYRNDHCEKQKPPPGRRRVPRLEPPRNHAPQPTARRRVQGQGGHCTPQAAQARTAATHGAKAAGLRIAGGPRFAQSRPQAARGEPHLLCLVGGITAPHRTPGPR